MKLPSSCPKLVLSFRKRWKNLTFQYPPYVVSSFKSYVHGVQELLARDRALALLHGAYLVLHGADGEVRLEHALLVPVRVDQPAAADLYHRRRDRELGSIQHAGVLGPDYLVLLYLRHLGVEQGRGGCHRGRIRVIARVVEDVHVQVEPEHLLLGDEERVEVHALGAADGPVHYARHLYAVLVRGPRLEHGRSRRQELRVRHEDAFCRPVRERLHDIELAGDEDCRLADLGQRRAFGRAQHALLISTGRYSSNFL